MEKIKKNWGKTGKASVYMAKESLGSLAEKLEYMISLPEISGLMAEDKSNPDKISPKIFMRIEKGLEKREKTQIVRDLLTIASFFPKLRKITAIREDKKMPKNYLPFPDFREYLREKGVIWDR